MSYICMSYMYLQYVCPMLVGTSYNVTNTFVFVSVYIKTPTQRDTTTGFDLTPELVTTTFET